MMHLRILSLVTVSALSLLAGCSGARPVLVDERFSDSECAEVQRAADMWNAEGADIQVVCGVQLEGLVGAFSSVRRMSDTEAKAYSHAFADGDTEGVTRHERTIVVNVDSLKTREPLWLLMGHEFGHLLGCQHVGHGDALMSEVRNDYSPTAITDLDRAELARATR